MANTAVLGLLRFPTEWCGAINCSPRGYVQLKGKCAHVSSPHGYICNRFQSQVEVCACHGFCQAHCRSGAYNVPENQMWKSIIAPYVNVPADNLQSAQVLHDCLKKLSGLDPANGLGILHGLLVADDDVALLEWLLVLGVDPDMPFIHLDGNDYSGLAIKGFDLATAVKLNCGTAAHFAAFFGRKKCLQLLVDVGANFDLKTMCGKKPLDLAVDGSTNITQDAVAESGSKTLAQLAHEFKYIAVRHRMRAGKVSASDFQVQYNGKTALEWIWSKMTEWQRHRKMHQDSLMPIKIMAEMRYRCDADAVNASAPQCFRIGTATAGACNEHNQEVLEEMKKLVCESNQTILEGISVLSGEIRKRKRPCGEADGES